MTNICVLEQHGQPREPVDTDAQAQYCEDYITHGIKNLVSIIITTTYNSDISLEWMKGESLYLLEGAPMAHPIPLTKPLVTILLTISRFLTRPSPSGDKGRSSLTESLSLPRKGKAFL